jgi:hypothetical protein
MKLVRRATVPGLTQQLGFLRRRSGRSGRDAPERQNSDLTIRGPNGEVLDITEKEMQAIKVRVVRF